MLSSRGSRGTATRSHSDRVTDGPWPKGTADRGKGCPGQRPRPQPLRQVLAASEPPAGEEQGDKEAAKPVGRVRPQVKGEASGDAARLPDAGRRQPRGDRQAGEPASNSAASRASPGQV